MHDREMLDVIDTLRSLVASAAHQGALLAMAERSIQDGRGGDARGQVVSADLARGQIRELAEQLIDTLTESARANRGYGVA